jgi:hypothetical protein
MVQVPMDVGVRALGLILHNGLRLICARSEGRFPALVLLLDAGLLRVEDPMLRED